MPVLRNPNLQVTDAILALKDAGSTDSEDWLVGPRPEKWWTGKKPADTPGFQDGVLHGLPMVCTNNCSKSALLAYFDNAWALTETLFSGLQGESAFVTPPYHNLRHPMIFYFAHPACFYLNKLQVAGLLKSGKNAYFEGIFEVGVDEMSWDDLSKNEMNWPAVADVVEYRREVYNTVRSVIDALPDTIEITQQSPEWSIVMGIEHEHIHLETSSVLIRELPLNLVLRPREWPENHPSIPQEEAFPPISNKHYPQNSLIHVPQGVARLGKDIDYPSFGWDVEYGRKAMPVPQFNASSMKISNGEFWEFVQQGGYRTEEFWSEKGWEWRKFRNVKWPTFWVAHGPSGANRYKLRLIFEVVEMPWCWPAEVNMFEAAAFCRWKSKITGKSFALPSEAQLHRCRGHREEISDIVADDSSGIVQIDPVMKYTSNQLRDNKFNFAVAWGSQSPVNFNTPSALGFFDLFGNVWEWGGNTVAHLPGCKVHPYYDDFSAPCCDGLHHMILGGSFISVGNLASKFGRYHFRAHFFQHCGFRVVEAEKIAEAVEEGASKYETDRILHEYFCMHYGKPSETFPYDGFGPINACDFPRRCADLLMEECKKHNTNYDRAFDLGCAVGRSTFELSAQFAEVVGIDLSEKFIDACNRLKQDPKFTYSIKREAEVRDEFISEVPSHANRDRCTFLTGDACNLPEDLGSFDAVLVANVVCRLPDPMSCLKRLRSLLNSGGIMMITTPFSWFEEYTAKDKWLGGFYKNGVAVDSLEAMKEVLSEDFQLVREQPVKNAHYS